MNFPQIYPQVLACHPDVRQDLHFTVHYLIFISFSLDPKVRQDDKGVEWMVDKINSKNHARCVYG
jgi:hypothetical protein